MAILGVRSKRLKLQPLKENFKNFQKLCFFLPFDTSEVSNWRIREYGSALGVLYRDGEVRLEVGLVKAGQQPPRIQRLHLGGCQHSEARANSNFRFNLFFEALLLFLAIFIDVSAVEQAALVGTANSCAVAHLQQVAPSGQQGLHILIILLLSV